MHKQLYVGALNGKWETFYSEFNYETKQSRPWIMYKSEMYNYVSLRSEKHYYKIKFYKIKLQTCFETNLATLKGLLEND